MLHESSPLARRFRSGVSGCADGNWSRYPRTSFSKAGSHGADELPMMFSFRAASQNTYRVYLSCLGFAMSLSRWRDKDRPVDRYARARSVLICQVFTAALAR